MWSVGSHYSSIDFDAVGLGYMSNRSDDDILAIGNAIVHGVEALTSKVSAASIRVQHQTPST